MAHFPPPLKKGDTIGVMSTSCWVEEDDVLKAKAFIESKGYKTYIHPQTLKRVGQVAGTGQEKAEALNSLFANPDVKAIFSSRGGNRACTMMDKIDFDLIRQNPKILIGYSDLTILLNAIYKMTGLIGYHGPLFRELENHPDYDQCMAMLSANTGAIDLSGCEIVRDGEAEGVLLGGNLSLFQTLLGTPFLPDTRNAILILEDVDDHISRYDRMLCHLKNAGVLQNISGLIIGSFSDIKDSENRPFGFSLKDIVLEHTDSLTIPIIMDAPFGHEDRLITLPIGAHALLKNGTLSFKAPA